MDNALLALASAIVAVTGTLLAPVLSQRITARVQADQFDRQERLARAQWQRERRVAERERRRDCYVHANAGYRRYRVELMNHLWAVHRDEVTDEGRSALQEARHAMHSAFAEAQMIASDAVMAELDALTRELAGAYARTMRLERGSPSPRWGFDEILAALLDLGDAWVRARSVMRTDLGVEPGPVAPDAAVDGDGPDGDGPEGAGAEDAGPEGHGPDGYGPDGDRPDGDGPRRPDGRSGEAGAPSGGGQRGR
ncbi:hypothetical protein ABZW32_31565 [Streptomyces sp. NPDC004667]|uniref:hypothetical protein n=1 Tax=Streptomyces sp. NPDC004667 TaxID=3154285 RepID=UPI0033A1274C